MAIGTFTWELLESFSKKELKALEKYLSSQESSPESHGNRLFRAFKETRNKDAAAEKLTFEEKDSSRNNLKQRVLHSRFLKRIKVFLTQNALQNHWWQNRILLNELHKRKLHKAFLHNYRQIKKELEAGKERSFEYYEQKFSIESIHQNQLIQFTPKSDSISFHEAADAFENWWIHQKLSLACFSLAQQKTREENIAYGVLMPEILHLIENNPQFKNQPVLQTYKYLYNYLTEKTRYTIQGLKQLVALNISLFSQEEKHNLFTIIYNQYLLSFNRTHNLDDAQSFFRIFEWGIKEELLLHQDRIPWNFYRNTLEICILLEKYEKARNYLKHLYDSFTEKERKELYPYFEGRLLYGQGKYKASIRHLYPTFPHYLLELTARFFYLQALYEQKDWYPDELLRILDRHGKYIKTNSHVKAMKSYKRYVLRYNYFRKLLKAKSKTSYEKLAKELKEAGPFSGKKWIEQKLREKKGS